MKSNKWYIILICVLALLVTAAPGKTYADVKLFDGSGPLQQDAGGAPVLKIIKPHELQIITTDDAFHIITKILPGFENGTRVHFERLVEVFKGGDVAEPDKGATHWWETALVGNWGLPFNSIRVEVDSLGGPGFYRVRVMGLKHGGNDNIGGWTPWRHFCVGPNQNCQMTLKKINAIKKPINKKESRSGKAPYKIGKTAKSNDQKKPSATPQPTRKKYASRTIKTPKANIIVQSISYTKPQGRKADDPFREGEGTTFSISFRNKGKAKSGKGHKYTISCIVKSGGPECPVKNETKYFAKEIEPNQTALVLLSATLKKAGEYHVTVRVIGERSVSQKTVKLKVVKKFQKQSKPKRKIKRVVPVPN